LDLVAVNQSNKVAYRGLLLELKLVDGCFIVLQVSAMQRASDNGIRARAHTHTQACPLVLAADACPAANVRTQREIEKPSMGVDSALMNV
jgi:hypothetical protein